MSARTCLLFGATGGVGRSTGELLVKSGWRVVAAHRREADAARLVEERTCTDTLVASLDVTDSIGRMADDLRELGITQLDAFVDCAAVTEPEPLELMSMAQVRATFEVNVFGPLHATQTVLPLLRAARGRIVFVSSTAGTIGTPMLGAYSASKFALEALADVLRRELGPWDVRVSLVIPGGIRTEMMTRHRETIDERLAELDAADDDEVRAGYRDQLVHHRRSIELANRTAIEPDLVARTVVRALDDRRPRARYVCGLPARGARTLARVVPDVVLDRLLLVNLPAGFCDKHEGG